MRIKLNAAVPFFRVLFFIFLSAISVLLAGGASVGRDSVRDGVLAMGCPLVRPLRGHHAGAYWRLRRLRRGPLQDILPRHLVSISLSIISLLASGVSASLYSVRHCSCELCVLFLDISVVLKTCHNA